MQTESRASLMWNLVYEINVYLLSQREFKKIYKHNLMMFSLF